MTMQNPPLLAKPASSGAPERNNTERNWRQAVNPELSDFRVGRREIIPQDEPLATLHAEPDPTIRISGAVLVLRLEQFPAAQKAVILFPAVLHEGKILGVFFQGDIK